MENPTDEGGYTNLIVEGLADGSVTPDDLLEAMDHLVNVTALTDAEEWDLRDVKEIRTLQTRVSGRYAKFRASFMELALACKVASGSGEEDDG